MSTSMLQSVFRKHTTRGILSPRRTFQMDSKFSTPPPNDSPLLHIFAMLNSRLGTLEQIKPGPSTMSPCGLSPLTAFRQNHPVAVDYEISEAVWYWLMSGRLPMQRLHLLKPFLPPCIFWSVASRFLPNSSAIACVSLPNSSGGDANILSPDYPTNKSGFTLQTPRVQAAAYTPMSECEFSHLSEALIFAELHLSPYLSRAGPGGTPRFSSGKCARWTRICTIPKCSLTILVKRKKREDGTLFYIVEVGNRNPGTNFHGPPAHDHPPGSAGYHAMVHLPRLNDLFKCTIQNFLTPELVHNWSGTMKELTWHVAAFLQENPYTGTYHLVRDPVLLNQWFVTLNNYVKKQYKQVKSTRTACPIGDVIKA